MDKETHTGVRTEENERGSVTLLSEHLREKWIEQSWKVRKISFILSSSSLVISSSIFAMISPHAFTAALP